MQTFEVFPSTCNYRTKNTLAILFEMGNSLSTLDPKDGNINGGNGSTEKLIDLMDTATENLAEARNNYLQHFFHVHNNILALKKKMSIMTSKQKRMLKLMRAYRKLIRKKDQRLQMQKKILQKERKKKKAKVFWIEKI